MKDGKNAILNDFIEPVKKAGKGGRLPGLYNLYVYFWRWALWKVFEHPFGQSGGIVSFITASSFITGDAFLGMRQKMRELCDEIWVIDLGGDGRGTQQDDNVFAIQTPVAITIAIRYKQTQPTIPSQVHYTRIEGSKSEKLTSLSKLNALSDLTFNKCPTDWAAPFLPAVSSSIYFSCPKLSDLMPWQQSGCKFERSWPIACSESLLLDRWSGFLTSDDRAIALKENRDRKINSKTADLFTGERLMPLAELDLDEPLPNLKAYGFRSFDRHFAIADSRVGSYLRPVLWKIQSSEQWHFISPSDEVITVGPAMTVSTNIPDLHYFNGRGAKDVIPLYRDDGAIAANIHPELLTVLSTKMEIEISPVDWACYLYGVMAHAGYTAIFKDELTSKDVRVPMTLERKLFQQAVTFGKALLHLHSYGERFATEFPRLTGTAKCRRAVPSNESTDSFNFDVERNILSVGDGEFGPISQGIWDFEVSGLKVLQSWLGYRMARRSGKKSSPLDDIGLTEWTSELTSELLRLLWILEKTLDLYPKQAELLNEILEGDMLLDGALGEVPEPYKRGPKLSGYQVELEL